MSESAKRRVQAIGNQLAAGSVPAIFKVAPLGPRVADKVIIITGILPNKTLH
jgi:hypothetical protein